MVQRIALVALLTTAACSADTPSSPTRESLEGVWRVISIQPASQPTQLAPVGVLYQVTFENGLTFARVDCNTCGGSYVRSGNSLTITSTLACTRAACPTSAYENAVVSLLGGEHQMAMTLHNLTLTSDRGTILLQR